MNRNFATLASTNANGTSVQESTGRLLKLFSEMGLYNNTTSLNMRMFADAYYENPVYAARLLMFNRNVRGGQKVKLLTHTVLENIDSYVELRDFLRNNLNIIPHFGYWKDLYHLENTSLWKHVVTFWCNQLKQDYAAFAKGEEMSLAAKYAPSESNGSSKKVANRAKDFQDELNMSPRNYRHMLTEMRDTLNIVEKLMSANKWDNINFSTVPSKAMSIYNKAFDRHTYKYNEWVNDDTRSVKTVSLTPVDIVASAGYAVDALLSKQWNNLPELNCDWQIFPVIDCSGSMTASTGFKRITRMHVSHALGLFYAHKLKGPYKNNLIEFSSIANYVQLTGDFETDLMRVRRLSQVANTNIESVFDLLLDTAIKHKVSQSELPTHLLLISDMQFNGAVNRFASLDAIKQRFTKHGYIAPHVIYWNVATNYGGNPVSENANGATLLSGYSPDILTYLMTGEYNPTIEQTITPLEQMMKVIKHEDYAMINW